ASPLARGLAITSRRIALQRLHRLSTFHPRCHIAHHHHRLGIFAAAGFISLSTWTRAHLDSASGINRFFPDFGCLKRGRLALALSRRSVMLAVFVLSLHRERADFII